MLIERWDDVREALDSVKPKSINQHNISRRFGEILAVSICTDDRFVRCWIGVEPNLRLLRSVSNEACAISLTPATS